MKATKRCKDCPRLLTPTDLKQRCERCKGCRRQNPGKPKAASHFTINPQREAQRERSKEKKPTSELTSWWMGLSRDQLSAEAQRRSDVKMGKQPISMSPTGVTT